MNNAQLTMTHKAGWEGEGVKKIYVVFGEAGEYSDWSKWCVRAFENEEDAKTHVELLQATVRTLAENARKREEAGDYSYLEVKNPLDDKADGYYTVSEAHYSYETIQLWNQNVGLEDLKKDPKP